MKSGLLWYDADPQAGVREKVARAAQRYRQKMGRNPTVCYLHPGEPGAEEPDIACRLDGDLTVRIRLAAAAQVLPHHFLVCEEEGAPARAAAPAERPGEVPAGPAGSPAAPAAPARRAAGRRGQDTGALREGAAARGGGRRRAAKPAR